MDINNESDTESRDSSHESNDSGGSVAMASIYVRRNNNPYQSDGVDDEIVHENEQLSSVQTPQDFDLTLPAAHSYLGVNLEELRGRTILDEGVYINLPLLVRESMVLFPGQTLPLAVFDTNTIAMLEKCIEKNHTFGVVCYNRTEKKTETIGTTAEIYEFERGSSPGDGLRIKAKGRQRFQILQLKKGSNEISANVKIVPEVTLHHPFFDHRLKFLDHQRIKPINEKEQKKQDKLERLEALITFWPAWVYRQYDPYRLSCRIKQQLQFIETRGSYIPTNPTDLSFWVAQNLPLNDEERLKLLQHNCAIPRLQWELDYLTKVIGIPGCDYMDRVLLCNECEKMIGKHSDIFSMSKDGPLSTFCNSGGYVHDTVTLYYAKNLKLRNDPPSSEYSWFPGYAWTIAECEQCLSHMGWRFTVEKDKTLKPTSFWGLSRRNLKSKRIFDKNLKDHHGQNDLESDFNDNNLSN